MTVSGAAISASEGKALLGRGCRQGALLNVPARQLRLRWDEAAPGWGVSDQELPDCELIVVSQDCDIAARTTTEPTIEAIATRWSTEAGEVFAARKGNSARVYLLQEEGKHALLADARYRVLIAKTSLERVTFGQTFRSEKERERFGLWVAGRYSRPAIADELVNCIHKPIVKAVDAEVKQPTTVRPVLDRVEEVRFSAPGHSPWTVDFVVMLADDDQLSALEEAVLNSWLESSLNTGNGLVAEIRVAYVTTKNISLHEYMQTTRLQLDHYSVK